MKEEVTRLNQVYSKYMRISAATSSKLKLQSKWNKAFVA
jgi:hypothetical protein